MKFLFTLFLLVMIKNLFKILIPCIFNWNRSKFDSKDDAICVPNFVKIEE